MDIYQLGNNVEVKLNDLLRKRVDDGEVSVTFPLFKFQCDIAKQKCFTNWADSKSRQSRRNEMLVLRGKSEVSGKKNLSE